MFFRFNFLLNEIDLKEKFGLQLNNDFSISTMRSSTCTDANLVVTLTISKQNGIFRILNHRR